ncbi:uncharacterized protein LOC143647615 [Tamandua tetradactyla]|uniref:uncharacterized protein LOC143647615 n=1 Tax=Tamandua tetradactyla TaxID=48850 RepID=UPI0040538EAE
MITSTSSAVILFSLPNTLLITFISHHSHFRPQGNQLHFPPTLTPTCHFLNASVTNECQEQQMGSSLSISHLSRPPCSFIPRQIFSTWWSQAAPGSHLPGPKSTVWNVPLFWLLRLVMQHLKSSVSLEMLVWAGHKPLVTMQ